MGPVPRSQTRTQCNKKTWLASNKTSLKKPGTEYPWNTVNPEWDQSQEARLRVSAKQRQPGVTPDLRSQT